MKVRTLIVAAMVITSVNAGGDDTPPSGAENSGGSRPKSGAPFGLRVIPLFQLPPRGSSGNGPNTPQESETAKQEPTGGSDVKNIPKDLIWKRLKQELIDLKKRYRKVWIELEIEDCSIESRPYLKSPEDMLEREYFPKRHEYST
ncbi:hypothetical protein BASA60_001871 [Batrachochytrium salamandrivorans]|nr:hypothetical protein BASA60_001871 [Batrachochytrium salamandrivorans]